ncbi:MAG: hypothetical protein H6642_16700 [Caldilineaceae bacterium]|nr:hypothetical protein [Caldilineaceae bacterium]
MYRREITPTDSAAQSENHSLSAQADSDSRPGPWGAIGAFAVIILLSLLGLAGMLAIGYYLPDTGAKAYWFVSRSSGIVAYGLITLGVLWGLVQSGALFRRRISPILSLGMHSYLNWLGLGLAGLHGAILMGDGYIDIKLFDVFTPFASPYRPVPVGLGIIGFYLMLLLSLSFYARMHLGQKNFRLLHYGSYGVFILVTLHGLYSGTDTGSLWWLYAVSLAAVAILTAQRIMSARGAHRPAAVSTGKASKSPHSRPAPARRP